MKVEDSINLQARGRITAQHFLFYFLRLKRSLAFIPRVLAIVFYFMHEHILINITRKPYKDT